MVAGVVIVITGATEAMPDLLADPVREEFGWSRGTISAAFAVNMALYGVTAPFAAALMDRFGIRRIVVGALTLIAVGAAMTVVLSIPAQLLVGWGLLTGLGAGSLALTFAATVTNRWFVAKRGLVSGGLTSAGMFGGMVLLPLLAWIVDHFQWRHAVAALGLAALVLVPVAWWLLRDHPADLAMRAYGAKEFVPKPAPESHATRRAMRILVDAARSGPFWLLVATFSVCGASTNGIMMTHFVPAAHEQGMPTTLAASLLALIGVFNVLGATGSGWLTDRFDPRTLLASYYGLRGVSLLVLPWVLTATATPSTLTFAVVYGLLDLATVPPTIALCRQFFGTNGTVVFGWVSAAHALGAGSAALLGGVARGAFGSWSAVWVAAGGLCVVAGVLSPMIRRARHSVGA